MDAWLSLQMNTAIEATYNINAVFPLAYSSTRKRFSVFVRFLVATSVIPPSCSNGHINLIISSLIGLADEVRTLVPGFRMNNNAEYI